MKVLPLDAGEDEIRALVLEWNELLAQEKYREALGLILYENTRKVDGETWVWTPEKLEAAVYSYGLPWMTREEVEQEFGEGSADYKVSSLLHSPNREELLKNVKISVERYTLTPEQAKMRCLENSDYENVVGDVLYDGVPLNDKTSDLTAIFLLKRVDEGHMTLCFDELHVM